MNDLPELTATDRETYQWQMWVPDFGEAGQRRLKAMSVLVLRCGGVGSAMAYYLAAAGVGRLVLAHGGNLKPSDLNRQILMTHDWLGRPRVECAARRLKELNPNLVIEAVGENVSEANVDRLVQSVDLVADCAPLFQERLLMNRAAVAYNKPLVDCAMYELQAQVTCLLPGKTACLACLYPTVPPVWKRQFPVFGAVAGMIGAWGAMEAIKLMTSIQQSMAGRMILFDLRTGLSRRVELSRDPSCKVCGGQKLSQGT